MSDEDQKECTSYFIEPVQWMEPASLGAMDGQVDPHCFTDLDTQLNRIIKTLLLSWKDIIINIIITGKDKELALIWIIVFFFL